MDIMDAVIAYDLKKTYGTKTALNNFNIEVASGSIFSLVGKAGCGKTTVLRLLAGLTEPTSGECTVLGLSTVGGVHRLHEQIGVVTDTAELYGHMSLEANLQFYATMYGIDDNDAIDRISFLLHELDIWKYRDELVRKLPTNAKQRANVARALIHSPKILLLDEPTEGMGAETTLLVKKMLDHITSEEEATVIISTRVLDHAELLSDSFAILDEGELIAKGNLSTLAKISGCSIKAVLKLEENSKEPAGFKLVEGLWVKNISGPEEMPEILTKVIGEGCRVYEANVVNPSLKDIYKSILSETPEVGEELEYAESYTANKDQEPGESADSERTGEIGEDELPQYPADEAPQREPEEDDEPDWLDGYEEESGSSESE